jgi:hypothetical protein
MFEAGNCERDYGIFLIPSFFCHWIITRTLSKVCRARALYVSFGCPQKSPKIRCKVLSIHCFASFVCSCGTVSHAFRDLKLNWCNSFCDRLSTCSLHFPWVPYQMPYLFIECLRFPLHLRITRTGLILPWICERFQTSICFISY